ncbi:auxin response factor 18-like [Durio zibethinus]|uniref:Auxin response factor n=1 Tax=Durio zibethinus TaxID=66656 RepID=A0A6P5Z1Q8_DURZI|nr:auxin response factor 18-like [Durio zibethinus]XP_022746495.1 auxin response factor 18-like [Durio zibethinus]
MITIMDSRKELIKNSEKCLDPQLWHACAGGMVQMPSVNSKVFYFAQGHAEHANGNVNFGSLLIPSLILCQISAIKFMADPETDEVYAKIMLVPLRENDFGHEDDGYDGNIGMESPEKPASFAKTLTQSDANNGGGFSVPRYCAETIFPRLDYKAEPPVQTILAKDVHGEVWRFRHIYRGTPRRHLLTTGWSNFVNHKKLVAGDSIVFLRAENGDLCVGILRAKRGIGSGYEYPSGWNSGGGSCGSHFGGYTPFLREEESKLMRKDSDGNLRRRVTAESVIEAATRAANRQPFEVVYYPRASTPEFCVKASSVRAAMQIQWYPGMRFKMAFETEDSSRISWFMGTISTAQVVDPIRWPNSLWRLLQVAWDEPDLLHNVKRISPWLVELVTNMPAIHLNPFSPPRKKMRLPQDSDFSSLGQIPMPSFSGNSFRSSSPVCCITDNIPGGIQGARHAPFGLSSSDLPSNKLHSGLFPLGFHQLDHTAPPARLSSDNLFSDNGNNRSISSLLTTGNPTLSLKESNEIKTPHILLFGQPIFSEQQGSQSCSGDTVGNSSSDGNTEKTAISSDGSGSALHQSARENPSDEGSPWFKEHKKTDLGLEIGHCKVFTESENVGRTLDLSVLGSYKELYGKLANMFGIESSKMLSSVLYRDAAGSVKHTGDEPFSEFLKTARRLTILMDSGSDNIGR